MTGDMNLGDREIDGPIGLLYGKPRWVLICEASSGDRPRVSQLGNSALFVVIAHTQKQGVLARDMASQGSP